MRALISAAVFAAPLLAARADESAPALRETLQDGVYQLVGGFEVAADPHLVWAGLTDFDSMPHYVPSIRSSVPETASDGGLVVVQQFEGKAFIFTRTINVRMTIQEQPERQIAFQDVAAKDFDTYQGSWQVQSLDGGTRVVYRLTAKPRGAVPGILGRGAFKDGAVQMLSELRAEMVRRSARQIHPETNSEGGTK